MSLGKTLFNFLLLTIAQAIIFKLAESFELLFDFGYLSVLIILFLFFAFIFTYFFYPKETRKGLFSSTLFYRDSGAVFLLLITLAIVRVFFWS